MEYRQVADGLTDSDDMVDGVNGKDSTKSAESGRQRHEHALAGILGPAFVAAVAYVDPGNVAANITSGARYGYLLVWVLVLANIMSVFIQYQSAKLGVVTGKSLPELLGERMSDAGRFMFFMQAEVIAIATDLAELIGGAIALDLLFNLPLFVGGLIIGAVSTVLLMFEGGSTQRIFEKIVIALLLVITFGFIAGLFIDPPNPLGVVQGLVPRFTNRDSVMMATSMLGATVMPHAIYLHSTLVNDHYAGGRKRPSVQRLLHGAKIDVAWALLLAGTVNLCLLSPCRKLSARHERYRFHRRGAACHCQRARPRHRHHILHRTAGILVELHIRGHIRWFGDDAWPVTHQSADVGMPRGHPGARAGGAMVRTEPHRSVGDRSGAAFPSAFRSPSSR